MRKIIIVGRGTSICRVSISENAAKLKEFNGVVPEIVTGSTRINALACINHTLEQLLPEVLEGKLKEPTVIYTVGLVVDMIHNGSCKYWLLGDGCKKITGEQVCQEEMAQWTKFFELYAQMILHIIFKDVSSLAIKKGSRIPVTNEQRILNGYVEQAWKKTELIAPTLEEDQGDMV
jgi:hypothetical protein